MSNQLVHALNFTHPATLGGGNDKDGERGELEQLAESELSRLKREYSDVFSDPTYPIDRSNAPI